MVSASSAKPTDSARRPPAGRFRASLPPPLAVFTLAVSGRLLLTFLFFLRFGARASQLIEIWYYYGVARGAFSLPALDPTLYLLRFLPLVSSPDRLYSAVALQALLLSSLTAVAVYFWVSRRAGRAAGFWAGGVFGILPAPISLSSANYSHDLVALPVILLFALILEAVFEGRRSGGKFLPAAGAAVFLLAVGITIGPLMAGFVVVVLFDLAWRFYGSSQRDSSPSSAAVFLGLLILANAGIYLVARDRLLDWIIPLARMMRGIDLQAQAVIGSADLQPMPPAGLWTRYNFFLFFLPAGLTAAFRRRDFLVLSLFVFSLALSLAVNRGARLLDLGVAAAVAFAFVSAERKDWKISLGFWALLLGLRAAFPAAASALRLAGFPGGPGRLLPGLSAVLAADGFRGVFSIPGMMAAAYILALGWILWSGNRKKTAAVFLIAVTAAFQWRWVWASFTPASVDLEWRAYRWLDERAAPGEKIFAAWNQGFLIGATTELVPVTTPDRIDLELPRYYWVEEDEAWEELRRRGVRYVHVNNRYFGLISVDERRDSFRMRGSTIIGPRPDHIRSLAVMRKTLLYRLLYEPQTLSRFRLILDRADPEEGVGVRIFLVQRPDEISEPD